MHTNQFINKWSALLLSGLLYIISLTQTGFIENEGYTSHIFELSKLEDAAGDSIKGFYVLLMGYGDVLAFDFSWFANIFYIIGWLIILCNNSKQWAYSFSGTAIFLGCLSFISPAVYSLQVGFYLWMASFIILFLYCRIYYFPKRYSNTLRIKRNISLKDDNQQP